MRRIALALCLLALGALAPTGSLAASTPVECSSTVAAGGTQSCSVRFTISDWRYISNIGTYANMIELGATGWLTMAWIDADGDVVAAWECNGFGVLGADVATIPYVAGSPVSGCNQTTPTATTFTWRDASGNLLPQRFVVRAYSTSTFDATFHGAMNLAQGNCTPDFCSPDLIPIPPR